METKLFDGSDITIQARAVVYGATDDYSDPPVTGVTLHAPGQFYRGLTPAQAYEAAGRLIDAAVRSGFRLPGTHVSAGDAPDADEIVAAAVSYYDGIEFADD